MTFAQVASSFSSDERLPTKLETSRSSNSEQHDATKLIGAKRPHSPKDSRCGRCFRSSHKTAECPHQVVCLRCVCVGHMGQGVQWILGESHD